jgi:hypothetical protein
MKSKWWPGRDKEWVIGGCTSCIPWPWDLVWLHYFPCPCRLRTVLTVDGSQVTDLLSWAHTCLWEREDSLLFCRGFWLFSDRLIGAGKDGGLSTTLRPGLKCGGLESKFRQGSGPLDKSGIGWSYLCLGYKWGMCFGVPSWDTLVHESPFPWDSTTWLWSSTVVRTRIWKMLKWLWLLNSYLKVDKCLPRMVS